MFKNSLIVFFFFVSCSFVNFKKVGHSLSINQHSTPKIDLNKDLIGHWITENKEFKVQVFEHKGELFGKLVDFTCTHEVKKPLKDHLDDKNPDPALRNRSWLNSIVLYSLKPKSKNKWEGGFVYDLTTGKTYSAAVTLNPNNTINVRGYWLFEIIGKSLIMTKTN